jgi:hypothetical protein
MSGDAPISVLNNEPLEKSAGVVNDTDVRFESTESSGRDGRTSSFGLPAKACGSIGGAAAIVILRVVGWPLRSTIIGLVERVPNPGTVTSEITTELVRSESLLTNRKINVACSPLGIPIKLSRILFWSIVTEELFDSARLSVLFHAASRPD